MSRERTKKRTVLCAGVLAAALGMAPILGATPALEAAPLPGATPAQGAAAAPLQHAAPAAPDPPTLVASPWVELRLGVGRGEIRDATSGGDRSAGAAGALRGGWPLTPVFTVVGGLAWSGFGCDGGFCVDAPVRFSGTGVDLGIEAHRGAAWAEVGLTRRSLEARWTPAGEAAKRSQAPGRVGVVLATGGSWSLRPGLALTPGIRLVRHGAAFEGGPSRAVTQLQADVGVRYRIPRGR